MLCMYCVANWFNLADEACEDAMYDMVDQRKPLASTRGYRQGANLV
jgi:IS5 family transposase